MLRLLPALLLAGCAWLPTLAAPAEGTVVDIDDDGSVEVLEAQPWMGATTLTLHDPATGTRRWSASLPASDPMWLEAVAIDGVVVVATFGPPVERHAVSPAPLFGLDAQTGTLLWTRRAQGHEAFIPRVVDGVLLVEHIELDLDNPRTERVDAHTGEIRWGLDAHLVDLPQGQGLIRDDRLHRVSLDDAALEDLGPAPLAVHPLGIVPTDAPRLSSGVQDVFLGMDAETWVLATVFPGSSTVTGRTTHDIPWTQTFDGRVGGGMPRHMQAPAGLVPLTVDRPDETAELLTLRIDTGAITGRIPGWATLIACDGALLVDGVEMVDDKTTLHRVDPASGGWTATRTLTRPGDQLDRRCLHDRVVLRTASGLELLDATTLQTVWTP